MSGRMMKISELSRASGVTRAAVHYYVNLGLLQRPKRAGLNLYVYDEGHLARLRRIRDLKSRGLSLAEIKEIFDKEEASGPWTRAGPATEEGGGPESARKDGRGRADAEGQENREKIVDMAIRLFSEKGYEHTKISDITEALRMGKSTFYLYFPNKRALFMECIDRLAVTIVPRESWEAIRSERDYLRKNFKRGEAFLKAFPGYRGILNTIRGAIGGRDPAMAQKAIEAFRVLSRPMLKDLRKAVAEGTVQVRHDEAFVAYLQLVVAEGFGYWQMIDPRYSIEEGLEILVELFQNGLLHPPHSAPRASGDGLPSGEVEDRGGVKTRLEGIVVDGRPVLPGWRGAAEVEVDLHRVAGISFFEETAARCRASLILREGRTMEIEADPEALLSGRAFFGAVRYRLKGIASVSLEGARIPGAPPLPESARREEG